MEAVKAGVCYGIALELSTDHSCECHGLPRKLLLLLAAVLKQNLVTLSCVNAYLAQRVRKTNRSSSLRSVSLCLHALTAMKLVHLLKKQYDCRLGFALGLSRMFKDKTPYHCATVGKLSPERLLKGLTPFFNLKVELLASRLLGFGSLRSLGDIYYTPANKARQSLDVFFRAGDFGKSQALLKVVVWAHGGGWMGGDKRMAPPLFSELARSGYVVVAPNYRHADPKTGIRVADQVKDLKCVIAWAKSKLEDLLEHRAQSVQVFVGGSSAGSHLALCCACTQNDPDYQPTAQTYRVIDTSVKGCIDVFGPKSLMLENKHAHRLFGKGYDKFIEEYLIQEPFSKNNGRAYSCVSPLQLIRSETCSVPPVFGVHGTFDCWVAFQESSEFYATLAKERTQPALDLYIEVPGAPHGFHMMNSSWSFSLADSVILWLDRVSSCVS